MYINWFFFCFFMFWLSKHPLHTRKIAIAPKCIISLSSYKACEEYIKNSTMNYQQSYKLN